jgi:hypothetical protein
MKTMTNMNLSCKAGRLQGATERIAALAAPANSPG